MLIALRETGEQISLVETWKKETLLSMRKKEQFYCPICKESLQLKLGEKKRFHFAHRSIHHCLDHLENESPYHIDGKTKLYHWLKNQNLSVQLEKYLPDIGQRPDLYVTYKEKQIAIEFQCATISSQVFHKRTKSYQDANIHVIWILGGKNLRRKGRNTFYITPFQELFTTNYHHFELLFFCPEATTFLKLGSSIYSFSPQAAISALHIYKEKEATFPMLFTKEDCSMYMVHREWCLKKKKWRLYLPSVYDKPMQDFLIALYEKGIKYLPAEIGVPLPSSFVLRSSPLLWQGNVFLHLLHPLAIDAEISLPQLCGYMNHLFHTGVIVFRQLTFLKRNDCQQIIIEYMEFLVCCGYFSKEGSGAYRKVKDFVFPNTIEEACSLDHETTMTALKLNFA